MAWRFSAGEPISHSPVAIGENCYVLTDNGGMYQLDVTTGAEKWWTPGMTKFLAASESRIYGLDNIGRIVVIDTKSGGRITTIPLQQDIDITFANFETDRILLGTKTGLLQCLHETAAERPLVHAGVEVEAKKESSEDKSDKPEDDAAMPKDDDPFGGGGGADPFGGGGGADPFGGGGGGGADPFGGGGGGGADPFGGGDDPFK